MVDSPDEIAALQSVPLRLFRALAATERRHALAVLAETDGPLDRNEFVTAVSRRLDGAVSRDEVAVSLTHVHLPALADDGLLEWDPESGIVAPAAESAELVTAEE